MSSQNQASGAEILVFGASGFLGQHLLNGIPGAVPAHADIGDRRQVEAALEQWRPRVVINCAGKTGRPNVDWCETHRSETLYSNVTGPLVLWDVCRRYGCRMVHLSSGCIFQGDRQGRGFRESDTPNFLGSYYARTKACSDRVLSEFPVLVLRPRMPFDDSLHPRSLLGKLVTYPRVLDVLNSLTYVPDMVAALRVLIDRQASGVVHLVNPGACSPYEIMLQYRALVDPRHAVQRLSLDELSQVAQAPRSNCLLESERLAEWGIQMRPVSEAVQLALMRIASQRAQHAAAADASE